MAGCSAFDASAPYVSAVLSFTDCHALALGADGWSALGPGTPFGEVFGGLLTVLVALVGYRMLLGEVLSLREGVSIALRIGIVLALATQWSAWSTLVYDVATRGPQEIAGAILPPGGLGGENAGGLASRVEAVSEALDELAHPPQPGAQRPVVAPGWGGWNLNTSQPPATVLSAPAQLSQDAQRTIASANGIMLVTSLGGLVAVRMMVALVLALGPVFIGFLLFEATRGLFASWARVLGGAALGAVAVPAVLSLALAVIEPQVAGLQAQLAGGVISGLAVEQIWASAMVFAAVLLAALIVVARAAAGLRLPEGIRREWARVAAPGEPALIVAGAGTLGANTIAEDRGRARQIADAVRTMERREEQQGAPVPPPPVRMVTPSGPGIARRDGVESSMAPQRLGEVGRRSGHRRSASAGRRDSLV